MTTDERRNAILHLPQAARFILAGGAAALVNWLVRFPLSLIMPFAAAVAVANIIGMACGFVAYRTFVFPASTRPLRRQLTDFIAVNLVSMVVVIIVSVIFADYLLPSLGMLWQAQPISHAIGIAAGAVTNYFGHRQYSFAKG